MDVSENRGTPKSCILMGFSIINHPFWGTPIFGNTHMVPFQATLVDFSRVFYQTFSEAFFDSADWSLAKESSLALNTFSNGHKKFVIRISSSEKKHLFFLLYQTIGGFFGLLNGDILSKRDGLYWLSVDFLSKGLAEKSINSNRCFRSQKPVGFAPFCLNDGVSIQHIMRFQKCLRRDLVFFFVFS